MGKHKKVINNDPILKKDYKYEKRKKERAQEKEAQRLQQEKQHKAKLQIAEIQNEVEEQIEKEIVRNNNLGKQKKIYKLPKEMFCKKSGQSRDKSLPVGIVNKQNFQIKKCREGQITDFYAVHFRDLPSKIKIARQHRQNKMAAIDRQVKQQIKEMFSIVGQKQQQNMMEDQTQKKPNKTKNTPIPPSQADSSNPYILIKQQTKERQLILNSKQLALFSTQAYQAKQALRILNQQEQIDIREIIIKSYTDYIHIQNKQQSTISEFRNLVVSHMVAHQTRCRSQQSNSKGFTNGKAVVLCPFFGDARNIFEILQAKYEGYETINKQKLEEVEDQNDFFRVGISVSDRKKTIRYFSHFNVSNYIVGSPVGLKAIVGSEGQSERDFSFLSSVEILYIDRASVIYMQNWDHLIQVVKAMNLMPNPESVCNDITKLRPSVPELMGKIYRQSIIFSQFNFPQLNGLKYSQFHNWQGSITTKILYPQPEKTSHSFDIQFYKMQLKQPKDDLEVRFDFFKRKFWDQIYNKDSLNKVVIFTRSYFEYIKLKEFLTRVSASADFISQNTKKPQVQSKISHFNSNKTRILLLTERAYYYSVCQIKKIQHLYLYSLPRNSYIYFELMSQIYKEYNYTKNKVVAIYTKYDIMALERIVGSRKGQEMVREYCSNVSFVI